MKSNERCLFKVLNNSWRIDNQYGSQSSAMPEVARPATCTVHNCLIQHYTLPPRSCTFSWPKSPFCFSYLEIKCPDPGIPDNGQRSGSLFYEGTQVRFSCDDGFELDGLRALECVRLCYSCSSVRWNGTTPTCRRIGKSLCRTYTSFASGVFPLRHWSFLYIKVLKLASCIRWTDLVK